jgi:predicted AlkP superfamily pyrophosphatase or phosphodiesterase
VSAFLEEGFFLPKRVLIVAIVAALVALAAAYSLQPDRGVPSGAPTENDMARALGAPIMRLIKHGHVSGRSGEVLVVPKPHSFLRGTVDLTLLGAGTPLVGSSHPNPWNYTVQVPIILSGGQVPKGVVVDDPVDISSVAPTYARLTGMSWESDGKPLRDIPMSGAPAPKVIFTVVLDGGGWDVLRAHPSSWPNIRNLASRGTTYTNATIGSAPAITGALHATFGTGDYPIHHGIPGNQLRDDEGKNVDSYLENADPRFLRSPTVAELWDERNANKPIVATVSYEGWHLGMIGHGSQRDGGDKDIAALWDAPKNEWWINEHFYELPPYLRETDLERLESYERGLDARDGIDDGRWFENPIRKVQEDTVRPGSPAFARFTGDAVTRLIRKEDLGADNLTDFVWIEMKMPDYAGHAWNMISPEEADVLEEVDAQIGRFVTELNRKVGNANYLFGISADHGQQPLPELYGGWRIGTDELASDIESRFGPIIEKITTVDIYVDLERVKSEGIDLSDVARYLGTYTIGDNIPEDAPGIERVPQARLDDEAFAGAFSTDYIQSLDDEKIASFGRSDYPQGNLDTRPEG